MFWKKVQDLLVAGKQVIVTVEATLESDQLKLLGRSVAAIDTVVADVDGMGLRIFVNEPEVLESVASVLSGSKQSSTVAGRGPITICLLDENLPGEVEMDLGVEFSITPQIKGAIKSLAGVVEVQDI